MQPTPVIALNRIIVIAELNGPAEALKAIDHITNIGLLKKYYLLPATLGNLYSRLNEKEKAQIYFEEAVILTQSPAVKKLLLQKIAALNNKK